MTTRIDSDLSRFERSFIFRVARGLPLVCAAAAMLVFIAATIGFAYSYLPVLKGRAPEKDLAPVASPDPPKVALALEDVLASMVPPPAPASPRPVAVAATIPPTSEAPKPPPSAAAVEIAELFHSVFGWAAARRVPWIDTRETYCAQSFQGTCYQTATRTVQGLGMFLTRVLARYNNGVIEESVALKDGAEYRINSTNAADKIAVLTELTSFLGQIEAGQERRIIDGWARLREEREGDRLRVIDAERDRVQYAMLQIETDYAAKLLGIEADYAAKRDRRADIRTRSVHGFGMTVVALFIASLILVIVAIERNTRTLHRVMQRDTSIG
jgi:hypothetical protein